MDNLIIMDNKNNKKDIAIENIDSLISLSDDCIEKH